jgi:hypothetical protein
MGSHGSREKPEAWADDSGLWGPDCFLISSLLFIYCFTPCTRGMLSRLGNTNDMGHGDRMQPEED